jgi:hypothetical protein
MTTLAHEYLADQRAYERSLGAEVSDRHIDMATDDILSDLDTLGDWLSACTCNAKGIASDYEARTPGKLLYASTAVVLHAALIAGTRGDASTALDAMSVLVYRYLTLRAPDVARRAADLADREEER